MKSPRPIARLLHSVRTALVAGVVSVLPFALVGCGQVSGSTQTQYAQLRVIDTSTSAGGLDIQVGSSVLAYNIGFGSVVNYTPVLPGTYTIAANQAGTKTVVSSVRGTLAAPTEYTLLIGNTAAGAQAQLLTDQSQPAPGNQVLVRLIDQATAIGSVDVYFIPAGGNLLTTKAVATAVNLNDIRTGIYVPTGTYQVVLLPAGTVPVAATATTPATTALYSSAATSLPAGSARTIVLLDTQVTTTPAVQVIFIADYDSPYATGTAQ
ncbi:DUF4397 domain-containing protein [Terriglobus aquaticus]|uniref:DUF4397 domain-containing protein n=1 Tax=Terriglobus aquaticus TaxID=940139 RepID=A0ABW9KP47_9BACT|nr:DUF4397 domain-containing protein [Terriglobus aquaticus]